MNILIYNNYMWHSYKYSKNDIFHVQNNRTLKGVLYLNRPAGAGENT